MALSVCIYYVSGNLLSKEVHENKSEINHRRKRVNPILFNILTLHDCEMEILIFQPMK